MSRGADRAARRCQDSPFGLAIVHTIVSALVLTVAVAGGVVNFVLLQRPMTEMAGGGATYGTCGAAVIVSVEFAMGLFLLEALGATRLLPLVGAFLRIGRVCMAIVSGLILISMAGIECGLAMMRDVLMQDDMATSAALRGESGEDATSTLFAAFAWLSRDTQMLLGAVLPFALMFAALPLETFAHSVRRVVELTCAGCLRAVRGITLALAIALRRK